MHLKRHLIPFCVLASAALAWSFVPADDDHDGDDHDDDDDDEIEIELQGIVLAPEATGTIEIHEHKDGPDRLDLRMDHLPPHLRVTVFICETSIPGSLPAQYLGEFTSDRHGHGRLKLETEIVDAFASANMSMQDASGIVHNTGNFPDALANGANTIPLNFIRGYAAEGGVNIFGPDEDHAGGGPVFIHTTPIP